MPLYSIQKYLHGIINGLALPGSLPPLTAWITPPVIEGADGPRAYVWGGRMLSRRQTAPRGPGYRRLDWTADLWLANMDTPDDALADESFALISDAVMSALWSSVMPVWIDGNGVPVGSAPTGEGQSQIQAIAEDISLDYPPERSTAALRMLWYTQHLGVSVLEVVQS